MRTDRTIVYAAVILAVVCAVVLFLFNSGGAR